VHGWQPMWPSRLSTAHPCPRQQGTKCQKSARASKQLSSSAALIGTLRAEPGNPANTASVALHTQRASLQPVCSPAHAHKTPC